MRSAKPPMTNAGVITVAGVGTNHGMYVKTRSAAGVWSGWRLLGGSVNSDVALSPTADGTRVVAVVRGGGNGFFSVFNADGTGWSGWQSLGGSLGSGPAGERGAGDHAQDGGPGNDRPARATGRSLRGARNHPPHCVHLSSVPGPVSFAQASRRMRSHPPMASSTAAYRQSRPSPIQGESMGFLVVAIEFATIDIGTYAISAPETPPMNCATT